MKQVKKNTSRTYLDVFEPTAVKKNVFLMHSRSLETCISIVYGNINKYKIVASFVSKLLPTKYGRSLSIQMKIGTYDMLLDVPANHIMVIK